MGIQRVAVVGAGVAGLTSAWLLSKKYQVSLYERSDWLGGHAHTLEVDADDGQCNIDTGFVVYNEKNYPNLIALFDHLGVATQPTDMSFSVSLNQGQLEYCGDGLNGLFAQRKNILNPAHWRLLLDMLRFNKEAKVFLSSSEQDQLSLGEYLERGNYSSVMRERYLLPMGAAIWSCPLETMLEFPAKSFIQFCENHGLLDLKGRPEWRTVTGGSQQYVQKLLTEMGDKIDLMPGVDAISRVSGKVVINSNGDDQTYDAVVLACHADQALALIHNPTIEETRVLSQFRYQENDTWLHRDPNLMPVRKSVWSCWNYLAEWKTHQTPVMSATYWANRLHRLESKTDYFISLNPPKPPADDKVISRMNYSHPIFDRDAVAAQQLLPSLQGNQGLWFCGSYAGYGFHEDAVTSAIQTCRLLHSKPPWESEHAHSTAA